MLYYSGVRLAVLVGRLFEPTIRSPHLGTAAGNMWWVVGLGLRIGLSLVWMASCAVPVVVLYLEYCIVWWSMV